MADHLSDKQQRFVEEYLADLNATQAAIRAKYSAKTARQIAARLLSKANIQAAIAAKRAELSERAMRTIDGVLADIGRVRADAMQEVTDPETGQRSMLSHKDALKALELEGKHLGMFTDKIALSGTVDTSVSISVHFD